MYLLLTLTWIIPVIKSYRSNHKLQIASYVIVCLSITVYGALLEWLQYSCTQTRTGEWLDVLADFLGAFIGVFLVALIKLIRH